MNPNRANKAQVRKALKAVRRFLGKQTPRDANRAHSQLLVAMVPKEARR